MAAVTAQEASYRFVENWPQLADAFEWGQLPNLTIDHDGNIFATDQRGHRVYKFSTEGEVLLALGETQFGWPSGIYISPDDTIYVADYQHKLGITIGSAKTGEVTGFIAGTEPEGVVVDAMGNVYSGEVGGRMLKKFSKQ